MTQPAAPPALDPAAVQAWGGVRLTFVCSGNICRSPMAQGLAALLFASIGAHPALASMGTLGIVGRPAAPHAVTAVAEVGGDIAQHRSQGLNAALLNAAHVNFIMEPQHALAIARVAPSAPLLLLSDLHGSLRFIPDPVGGTLAQFRSSRDLIADCLRRWMRANGLPV
jgi:protein-tyrosine phosphatase